MTSSLVVLRTSVLVMFLLTLITGFYVRQVTRLSVDAGAQAAGGAAAQVANSVGWQCGGDPPEEAVVAAAQATWGQMGHLGVQPISVEVYGEACNLIVAVTAAPLDGRVSGLQTTAVACRSVGAGVVLSVPGAC